jgi:hypothetical protein
MCGMSTRTFRISALVTVISLTVAAAAAGWRT